MFTITDSVEVDWPVKVQLPKDGKHETHSFKVRFSMLPADEAKAAAEAAQGDEDQQDDLLKQSVVSWSEVVDDDGNAVEFSAAMLERMLRWPWVKIALYRAYTEAVIGPGREHARQGN